MGKSATIAPQNIRVRGAGKKHRRGNKKSYKKNASKKTYKKKRTLKKKTLKKKKSMKKRRR